MTTYLRANRTAEEKEAVHQEAESRISSFSNEKPETEKPKDHTHLVGSGLLRVAVQTVREVRENNFHYYVKASEITQMIGFDPAAKGRTSHVNIEAHKEWMTEFGEDVLQYDEGPVK